MPDINIEELKKEFGSFENIPSELFDYVINAIEKNISDRYIIAISGENRLRTLAAIDDMFVKAVIACKLSPKEIIKGLDFNPKDCGPGRIEAFFAELRTINGLAQFGFTKINQLKANNSKQADITAYYNNDEFVVEVFHSAASFYRFPNHSKKRNDFINYFIDKAGEKKKQLDSTAGELRCEKMLLICILDSQPMKALSTTDALYADLKIIHNKLNWGPNYYYGIITGQEDLSGQAVNAIYPLHDC